MCRSASTSARSTPYVSREAARTIAGSLVGLPGGRLRALHHGCTAPLATSLHVALESPEALEVIGCQRGTVGRNHSGVLTWQAEGHPRLGVGEHGRAHGGVELVQVLVGGNEAHAQAAGLGQRVGEVQGQVHVVLKLIDVDKDRMAALGRDGRPAEDGLPEL